MITWKVFPCFYFDKLCNSLHQSSPTSEFSHKKKCWKMWDDHVWVTLDKNGSIKSKGLMKWDGDKVAIEQVPEREKARSGTQSGTKSPILGKEAGCREVLHIDNFLKQGLITENSGTIHPWYTSFVCWAAPEEKHILAMEIFYFNYPLSDISHASKWILASIQGVLLAYLYQLRVWFFFSVFMTETALLTTLYNLDPA